VQTGGTERNCKKQNEAHAGAQIKYHILETNRTIHTPRRSPHPYHLRSRPTRTPPDMSPWASWTTQAKTINIVLKDPQPQTSQSAQLIDSKPTAASIANPRRSNDPRTLRNLLNT
jgi:hypothetical protein